MSHLISSTLLRGCAALLLCISLAAHGEEDFSLDMRNADLREFIYTVGKLTGKTMIIDDQVSGTVEIKSYRQLTADELYNVFLTQLSISGYAAMEVGRDIIKVIPRQDAKVGGLSVQRTDGAINATEQLVTRIIQVNDADVEKLVVTLRPLVDNKFGLITAYADSNVIVVTDNEANINRLMKIISEVDRADSQSVEAIKLQNASAKELERILARLTEQQRNTENGGTIPVILADERTNMLVIRADTATRAYLRKVVKELDGAITNDANTRVFYLKYANAAEVSKVLQGISQTLLKRDSNGAEAASSPSRSDSIYIEAHEQTNAIVLSGSPQLLGSLEEVIRKLDIRRAQVLVEAIIVELSDDKSKELGVQWLFRDGGSGNVPVGAVNFADGQPGILNVASAAKDSDKSVFDLLSASSGSLLGVGRNRPNGLSFAALLKALASDSESNVLSTPSLLTMDNEEASILVGREVPVITGSTASSTNTNPFQTISRQDIGVKLSVKPQINDGDTVQLTIEQEVSSLTGLTASDIITNKRVIKTTVLVDNEATIALGGLIDEDVQESNSRVPVLGDIPVLGHAFSTQSSQKVKRNLMVFIRPTILQDDPQLARISRDKYQYMRAEQLLRQEKGIKLMPDAQAPLIPPLQDAPATRTDADTAQQDSVRKDTTQADAKTLAYEFPSD